MELFALGTIKTNLSCLVLLVNVHANKIEDEHELYCQRLGYSPGI